MTCDEVSDTVELLMISKIILAVLFEPALSCTEN